MGCPKLTYHDNLPTLKVAYGSILAVEKPTPRIFYFNRKEDAGVYRYGFNGYENDDEVKGNGNHLDFGNFGYDTRLGRRWNIDPVVKTHESPYAAFANNPIWFVDVNGMDTLVMNRSSVQVDKSTGQSNIYIVTFSLIKDGVESNLNTKMYMIDNAKASKKGDNGLRKESYKLKWDQLSAMTGEENWENTIRVTEFGVFIHPGNDNHDFNGCYGLSCDEPETFTDYGPTPTVEDEVRLPRGTTIESLQLVRDLYNQVNGKSEKNLTGDKFILKTNSKAPKDNMLPPPIDSSLEGNPDEYTTY